MDSGKVFVQQLVVERVPSFLEYIQAGTTVQTSYHVSYKSFYLCIRQVLASTSRSLWTSQPPTVTLISQIHCITEAANLVKTSTQREY